MTDKESPLPQPPNTPFGRTKNFEQSEGNAPLMADRMSMAMAEGRLDEFMQKTMPDNEHARSLAMMMMGMTGMMPGEGTSPSISEIGKNMPTAPTQAEQDSSIQPPEDVIKAAHAGDVKGLKEMLEREHKKRTPDSGSDVPEKNTEQSGPVSSIEKEQLDQIVKIAYENNTSVDWLMMRALRLYIQEYQKTGRL